jgi:hypothetical protein
MPFSPGPRLGPDAERAISFGDDQTEVTAEKGAGVSLIRQNNSPGMKDGEADGAKPREAAAENRGRAWAERQVVFQRLAVGEVVEAEHLPPVLVEFRPAPIDETVTHGLVLGADTTPFIHQ